MNLFTAPRHILASLVICILILIIVVAHIFSYGITRDIRKNLETNIREQESYLFELAELIDRNAADAKVAQIVTDCTRRQEYENLLSTLPSLTKKDLLMLQTLSEGCGSFYAEQKALMTLLFESTYTTYDAHVRMYHVFDASSPYVTKSELLREILSIEQSRTSLLRDQTLLQDKIIAALISGMSLQSKDVQKLAEEAQNIQELLEVSDVRADALRSEYK